MMRFDVLILGSSSATPTSRRTVSAQLVRNHEKLFLVDCGEGTQMQMRRNKVRFGRLNTIFISHLHGDHFFGLIGLISSLHLFGRKSALHIYGPEGLKEIIEIQLAYSKTILNYPLLFHETNTERFEMIYENEDLEIYSIPLIHRIPCNGYLFKEKPLPRKIDKGFLKKETNIPLDAYSKIKSGDDYVSPSGKIFRNSDITLEPPKPRAYAYCSDTQYTESIVKYLKGVDLLYHEATFSKDRLRNAQDTAHSTSEQAALIASLAGVKKLLIGHFSSRYDDVKPLLMEAQFVFSNTEAVEEGMVYEV